MCLVQPWGWGTADNAHAERAGPKSKHAGFWRQYDQRGCQVEVCKTKAHRNEEQADPQHAS